MINSAKCIICLCYHLHDCVLDTIMDGLHIVACTTSTDMCHTGTSFEVSCGYLCEKWRYLHPYFPTTSWHNTRTMEGSLLTTRDTTSDILYTFFSEHLHSPLSIHIVRVTAVDDDISDFQKRYKLTNDGIDWGTCLYHEHDLAWALERCDK